MQKKKKEYKGQNITMRILFVPKVNYIEDIL